jgi:hypothetical protein
MQGDSPSHIWLIGAAAIMRCALVIALLQLVSYATAFVTPALLRAAPAVSQSSRMHMTVPSSMPAVDLQSTQLGSDNLIALGTTGIKEADQLGMDKSRTKAFTCQHYPFSMHGAVES